MAKHSIKGLSLFLVTLLLVFSLGTVGSSAHALSRTVSNNSFRYQSLKVYAGGVPFGVKFLTAGVLVVGFAEIPCDKPLPHPAKAAGLAAGDILLSVGGKPLSGASDLTALIERSGGIPLPVRYERDGVEHTTTLTPVKGSDGRYSGGIYVRDSGAGIGTVTFVIPKTGAFAGLGHGICDGETGELIPMDRGSVVDVTIHGVVRGLAGSPGEVRGYFKTGKIGTLLGNSHLGVWGVFADLPQGLATAPVSLGSRHELKEGKATLRCTLDGASCRDYEIEISDIHRASASNKCFTVKVTDKALLEKTGGIIQGMSGSPIFQNGKLVGAVTHVLINDPASGYGIFIENMLDQMGDLAG